MSQPGAPAAYRGYRLQALYILKRMLSQKANEHTLQPEGKEDLDILDSSGALIETVQVKSYPGLAFSDLWDQGKKDGSRGGPNSVEPFFKRSLDLLEQNPSLTVKLVNFGHIGPELELAWSDKAASGSDQKATTKRQLVKQKLEGKGISPDGIEILFEKVRLVPLDEDSVISEVFGLLSDIVTGLDPENAFDLLNFWIYRFSEKQQSIDRAEVIKAVRGVGKFLAECRARHTEWFTSITPIEDQQIFETDKLREEFYQGVSARYEHIVANLDFLRPDKLDGIAKAFEKHPIVIVHAASGQGKTTLAYRYLHDNFPENWRFSIELIDDRQHALRIAAALNGHAAALKVPTIVYIDVRPNDTAWPELVSPLMRNPHLKILVTIREEDFKRADLLIFEIDYADIDLDFDETEARMIYERAVERKALPQFLDFETAWAEFGGKGPLMEFVFLMTQTIHLEKRLSGQVQRIRRDVREKNVPDELKLLRLVAVATAFEARVHTRGLIESLDLGAPGLTLDFFEDEYLIRQSSDKQYIEALHPIRSGILARLLTGRDVDTWIDAAGSVLPMLFEEDLESFLFHAFLHHWEDYKDLLAILFEFQPGSWTGVGGVLRSLLWAGVRDYIDANRAVIQSAIKEIGIAWWQVFDFDLVDQMDGSMVDVLWNHISAENKKKIMDIRSGQLPKSEAFGITKRWLSENQIHPASPVSQMDWRSFSETIFWASFVDTGRHMAALITDSELSIAASELSLPVLADASFGLYACDRDIHKRWMDQKRNLLEERAAKQFDIVAFENDETDESLVIHFIVRDDAATDDEASDSNAFNKTVMERVNIIHRLFPEFEKYVSKGYGWKAGGFEVPIDPTLKNISRKNLMSNWAVRINRIAYGLAEYERRPETWEDYILAIFNIRNDVISCLLELQKGIDAHFSRNKPTMLLKKYINTELWDACIASLSNLPKFPKVAVDPWGLVSEGARNIKETFHARLIPHGILLQQYNFYSESSRKYLNGLNNFFSNAIHVIATNARVGKIQPKKRKREELLKEIQKTGLKTDMDHLTTRNLWEALKAVEEYQKAFEKLFGIFIDADALTRLEEKERELISNLWKTWYFYARMPHIKMTKDSNNEPYRLVSASRDLDKKIEKAIKASNSTDMSVSRLRTDLRWDTARTIWIELDLKNLVRIYESFEKMVRNMKRVFSEPKVSSLEYYIIEEHYEHAVIIPLFRGKLFSQNVWMLKTKITLCDSSSIEDKQYLYMMQPISTNLIQQLGYETWKIPEIGWADQLTESFSKVWLISSQIYELNKLSVTESVKLFRDTIDHYGKEMSSKFNDHILMFTDIEKKLLNRYNQMSEEERGRREELMQAISLLSEVHKYIWPFSDGEKKMVLDEIGQYAASLEKNLSKVEIIRLLWITDALNHEKPK